ncbi:Serine/threonine-protein kinase HT1 [Morella rubra]|uniref:non-specific serine/threonine protein kinase n=1 Tax=Morella rubra TaxID=262757 RepID=A0A6A1VZN3_9ROSI|nr:Serine/threonine-protein kinase HT1 [Morella rubra]
MDLMTSEDGGIVKTPKKMDSQEASMNSKVKGTGSVSCKGMMFRADQIDLRSLDIQLEKHLNRVWSKNIDSQRPKEEWEIDLSKLDIRYELARGAYGTVYRGTYDSQDVAGILNLKILTRGRDGGRWGIACQRKIAYVAIFVNIYGALCTRVDIWMFMPKVLCNSGDGDYYNYRHDVCLNDGPIELGFMFQSNSHSIVMLDIIVKLLDWGEDGIATSSETAALRASFQQEVAVWHKLDHPNVTKFVGASMGISNLKIPSKNPSIDGHNSLPSRACCVVVEYLPGGTLKQFLIRNRRKKLAFKDVIQLALDLSRGLSYLHSKKIVHRDVKTENMLLNAQRTLKIADFGVARVEAQNPMDMTGETGTLGYMAPEVLDGKPYNRRCDVYSFGICLWEIYCCDMPYPDLSFADVSSAVVRQNLRPEIPRCCPSSLANIMRKCWDANADKRPEMDEVVRMLEAIDTSKGGGMIPEDQARGCFCFAPARGP